MIIVIDPSGWTQTKKNMTKAMCVHILHGESITYDSIQVALPEIDVVNPSSPVTIVLTTATLSDAYDAWKIINDAANAESQAESVARQSEIAGSVFRETTLEIVNTAINNISSIAELKEFLRKFAKYVISRGI